MDAAADFDRGRFFGGEMVVDRLAGRDRRVEGRVLRRIELAVVPDRIGVLDHQRVVGLHQQDVRLEAAVFVVEHHFTLGIGRRTSD